nr:methanethiol S-methyltransferase-like [Nerophis lumbriciformis]
MAVLLYGIVSYMVGVAGLACLILAIVQLTPFGFLDTSPGIDPIVWNLALVALWGFFHTAMARQSFKNRLTRFIPEPAERPTYVLNLPGVLWSTSNAIVSAVIWSINAFGWIYLLAALYLNFENQPRPPLVFTKRAMYRFTRHPIQTGVLIGIWALPTMTTTQLVLSIGFTLYIFVGLWFEEKDLVKEIGEPYQQYRRETGKLLPRLFK